MGLGAFDGRDVRRTQLSVTGTGALQVGNGDLHLGDRVYIVVEAVVDRIDFQPDGGDWDIVRRHIARTTNASLVDEHLVRDVLDAHADEALAERERLTGEQRFEPVDTVHVPLPKSKVREHAEGLHKRKRKDCPQCQSPDHPAAASVTSMAAQRAKKGPQ